VQETATAAEAQTSRRGAPATLGGREEPRWCGGCEGATRRAASTALMARLQAAPTVARGRGEEGAPAGVGRLKAPALGHYGQPLGHGAWAIRARVGRFWHAGSS
jgi:hypothetical protein